MSITLKTNQVKLKIQNGNYQSPVVIADQTTAEHVAEVNTAITTTGNQQVSAIQTKGDEVLNSIPENYTELVEEVDDLKSIITYKLEKIESANLFDSTKSTQGILSANGLITESVNYCFSDFIPVETGDVLRSYYVATSNQVVYAANMIRVCAYDSSKNVIQASGQDTNTQIYTVLTGIRYVRITFATGLYNTAMIIANNNTVPSAYIPYADPYYIARVDFINKALNEIGVVHLPITKEDTDFWERERSENLYNPKDVIQNEYFNQNGTIQENTNTARAFVELDGAGTYSFKVDGAFFGLATSLRIPCFDISKNFVKTLTATTEETTPSYANLCTLVISPTDIADGVRFIGFTMANNLTRSAMVVKSDTYPEEYIQYYSFWTLPDLKLNLSNPLFNKTIIFDGDSICAGLGSAMGNYGNGWAGRIGIDYGANAINVGVSGACITANTYFDGDTNKPRHWIARYIDTIYNNYPDADYIIAEGGTNDADNFYNNTSRLGTFSETDFAGPFDDSTFYGAMDSWCKKALTYYPKAKIGFIVAHKMGDGFVTYVKNRYDYFTYASKVCKKWGIPVLNLWDNGQLRPDVISMYDRRYNTIETATEHGLLYYDGQHLTAYGYDVISRKIAEWMKTL